MLDSAPSDYPSFHNYPQMPPPNSNPPPNVNNYSQVQPMNPNYPPANLNSNPSGIPNQGNYPQPSSPPAFNQDINPMPNITSKTFEPIQPPAQPNQFSNPPLNPSNPSPCTNTNSSASKYSNYDVNFAYPSIGPVPESTVQGKEMNPGQNKLDSGISGLEDLEARLANLKK